MRVRMIVFLGLLSMILVACGAAEVEPTPNIAAIVDGTVTAREAVFYQPTLQEPADNTTFANPADVVLTWDWIRDLGENEYFDVRVWREGEPQYGITWTQENSFGLDGWLSTREAGEYFWSVAVIEGADGEVTANIAEAAPERSFTVESNVLPTETPTPQPTDVPIGQIVRLPEGFIAEHYYFLEEAPTSIGVIEFDEDGSMLVLTVDGRMYRLSDTDGDHVADEKQQILFNTEDSFVQLEWAIGLARYMDRYYVSDKGRIGYLEDLDGDGIFDEYTNIIDGLPNHQYPLHSNNGIVFDSENRLYIGIGSTTDHGPLQVEWEASVLRMEPDGSNVEVFATGFRNPYDLAFSPDDELFTTDNAPDGLDQTMAFYPPEELNHIREGRDYGFPDVYGHGLAIRDVERETEDPVTDLTTSSVNVGLVYYAADHFPEYYRDGIFAAQFGGFNGEGREVVFVPLEPTDDGTYTGTWEDFARFRSGFNPIDVTVGPDGALYMAEYSKGYILRVTYTG